MARQADYKMLIWGDTLKATEVYSLGRTDDAYVQQKFEQHLHTVMHRAGEVIDNQF